MAMTKQVLFQIGGEEYGIDISEVKAIEKYMVTVSIPNAPNFIEGIINLRGDVIPIFSLRSKFGLEKKCADDNTQLLIVKSEDMLVAFEVDNVTEIVEIEEEKLSDVPVIVKSEKTSYIKNVVKLGQRLIISLDIEGIFEDSEKDSMKSIVQSI